MTRTTVRLRAISIAATAVVVTVCAAGCGSEPPPAGDMAMVQKRQAERLVRLADRHDERDDVVTSVATQRQRALDELRRIDKVRGHSVEAIEGSRYGSDGTGDPEPWVQSGPRASTAPNSTSQTIAQFEQATARGRIQLVGAAKDEEVHRGLIDDRVLGMLLALSAHHRLQVNSLRVSHPRNVQDDLGTPTESNHVFGRSADVSAVDGVPCGRETRRAAYRTILDNPPPALLSPCLSFAYEAARIGGDLAAGEIIYYWRVPGPAGVSMPNHDDHVHLGFRSYPGVNAGRPSTPQPAATDGQSTGPNQPPSTTPAAGVDTGSDLQIPDPGPSHTLEIPTG